MIIHYRRHRAESSIFLCRLTRPLLKRMTQMMPAELLAVTGVLLGMNGMAADCDVTTTLTTIRLAALVNRWRCSQDHHHHFVLNARVGYEHVPSGRNVPTVSSQGLVDPEAMEKLRTGEYSQLETHNSLKHHHRRASGDNGSHYSVGYSTEYRVRQRWVNSWLASQQPS